MFKALRFLGWPLLVGVLSALLIMQYFPHWVGLPTQDVQLRQAPIYGRMQEGPVSYADAVSTASPAVANLYTTKFVNKPAHPMLEDEQFRKFFGDNLPKQRRMESSLGSAVIMSTEGYLLTNNHVVAGADQIVVSLGQHQDRRRHPGHRQSLRRRPDRDHGHHQRHRAQPAGPQYL
jgi:serine protease DegS